MDTATNAESAAPAKGPSLAERIQAGDRLAEEELYVAYRRGVFLIAAARTRNQDAARDLAQEVFVVVLRAVRAGQLREPDKLAAFIQGIARNIINNFLRSQARRAECDIALADSEPHAPDLVGELESGERRHWLRQQIESFSTVDRQILLWSLVDGHSLSEIAARLKMSHEAVRARKSRIVRKMMKKFAGASHNSGP